MKSSDTPPISEIRVRTSFHWICSNNIPKTATCLAIVKIPARCRHLLAEESDSALSRRRPTATLLVEEVLSPGAAPKARSGDSLRYPARQHAPLLLTGQCSRNAGLVSEIVRREYKAVGTYDTISLRLKELW